MKTLLPFLLLTCISARAQDCDKITKTYEDRFTGNKNIAMTKPVTRSKGGKIEFYFDLQKDTTKTYNISVIIHSPDIACTDDERKVNFLFEDGTKYECYNNASYNCEARFFIFLNKYFNHPDLIQYLKKKNLKAIRFAGVSSFYEIDLTKAEAASIKDAAVCLFGI
jgi:hypothetical protein